MKTGKGSGKIDAAETWKEQEGKEQFNMMLDVSILKKKITKNGVRGKRLH